MTQPSPELDPKTAATVGRIIAPHGIRGEVKVEPLTDFPGRFRPGSRLWLHGRSILVRASRSVGKLIYVTLAGVTDRDGAEALRGELLQVPDLPPLHDEGVFYQHDIVGLAVETEAGEALGRIESIFPTGANDVYVVRGERGELLLPAVDDVIKSVDLAGGRLVIDLLPGLEFSPGRATDAPRTRRPARPRRPAKRTAPQASERGNLTP